MADSNITKQALATSIKSLMDQKTLSKISVRDITEHCGVNRQTFYYHFKDKYELVNWIYYTDTLEFMSSFSDRNHWTDGLSSLCNYMQTHKRFYINALNISGQNSFEQYLTEFIHGLVRSLAEELLEERKVSEEELDFIASFYAYGFVGLIVQWAKHGMKEDPKIYIERIKDLVNIGVLHDLTKYK